MKKIDKYLLNDFLKTFIFTISLILLISIVFDISEKIDDFVSNADIVTNTQWIDKF